jgi:hypothetical protein
LRRRRFSATRYRYMRCYEAENVKTAMTAAL